MIFDEEKAEEISHGMINNIPITPNKGPTGMIWKVKQTSSSTVGVIIDKKLGIQ